jgi:hypothetical protein
MFLVHSMARRAQISVPATAADSKNDNASSAPHDHPHGLDSSLEAELLLRPYQQRIEKIPGVTPKAAEGLVSDLGIEDRIGSLCVQMCLKGHCMEKLQQHVAPRQRIQVVQALADRLEQAPAQLFCAEFRGDRPQEHHTKLSPSPERSSTPIAKQERRRSVSRESSRTGYLGIGDPGKFSWMATVSKAQHESMRRQSTSPTSPSAASRGRSSRSRRDKSANVDGGGDENISSEKVALMRRVFLADRERGCVLYVNVRE